MESEGGGVSLFVDLTPSGFRATQRARRAARAWVGLYVGTALVLAGSYVGVTAGRSQRERERDHLAGQLKQEWERNKEAQRLLGEIHRVEETITRYDRLASPVRASDVVGTIGSMLPPSITLTSLTLTPRQDRITVPAAPGSDSKKKTEVRTLNYLAVELEGVVTTDGELAGLVLALESCPLFDRVAMDFARSTEVDGTPARAFRLSARVDFTKHYAFLPAPSGGEAGASAERGEVP